MTEHLKKLVTVVDVVWVREDYNWRVDCIDESGTTYVRFFYGHFPPTLSEEVLISI